ncbi:MAG: hypothetical protein ABIY70_10610 [Capsulimonas sp.]|uniref:hypothetical protein n=1 Tax=Capsulimonas sp. TaxID=2494211 RepID=UPI003266235C
MDEMLAGPPLPANAMPRNGMLDEMINSIIYPVPEPRFSPVVHSSEEDWQQEREIYYRNRSRAARTWAAAAPAEWLDVLIDLHFHPADDDELEAVVKQHPDMDPEYSPYEMEEVVYYALLEWAKLPQSSALTQLGVMLRDPIQRVSAIQVLWRVGKPELLEWLIPMAGQVADLNDSETSWLISALGGIHREDAERLLEQLAVDAPARADFIHKTLEESREARRQADEAEAVRQVALLKKNRPFWRFW